MALFSGKTERVSVALIDINSSSVGGALAHLETGAQPVVYFTQRMPIEIHGEEDLSAAMLRTLDELTEILTKKGAPTLRQETKSGHIDRVFISIGAPWQATAVRTEHVNETKPFTFTKAFLSEITRKSSAVQEGFMLSGESVIATLLNGYAVQHPFGKRVTRAELIILSSFVEKQVADSIEKILRKTYHTHALTITAFPPIAYTVFRDIFPHEKDFLVLDVSGETTDTAFIKRELLVDVSSVPHGMNELVQTMSDDAVSAHAHRSPAINLDIIPNKQFAKNVEDSQRVWLELVTTTLRGFSAKNALPRTLFLLTDDESREYLKNLLDSPVLRTLWLTDEPLSIIPILPSQFSAFIKYRASAEGDIYLALLAMFASRQLTTS